MTTPHELKELLPDNATPHGRAMWEAIGIVQSKQINIRLGDTISDKIEPIIKAYLTALLSDPATVERVAKAILSNAVAIHDSATGYCITESSRNRAAQAALQAIREMV